MMSSSEYVLDIPMCVYNHEKFIAQAIEGVVRQKTNFKYRLIIGEDCSTDGTRDIVKKYLDLYPEKLKVYFHEPNIGPYQNSKILFSACTSKYVALCDGDDYWCDDTKLQQQVDFLEKNTQYVGCFHNTEERFENDMEASVLYCNYSTARNISFKELSYQNVIPTCSVVYRNRLFGDFPDWFIKLKMGDWPLHLLNAQLGDFWYIPKVMGVHRLHQSSMWMLQDTQRNIDYIVDAYDLMIKGLAPNQQCVNDLIEGRNVFIKKHRQAKNKPGIKKKIKSLMVKAIEKL